MATTAIIPSENLDISRVTIGEIRPNKAGGKTVPIKYNGQTLQVRIPRIYYPAGVVVREDDSGKKSYSLLASLKGCDSYAKERSTDGSEVGQFYNFLLDLSEKVVAAATANSGRWFGKARSEAVIRDTFKPILTPSVEKINGEWVPNGKYPPSLRMKISIWDGQVGMDAVDEKGNTIALTEDNLEQVFAKRMEGRMVIAPSIYVTGTGCGVTWRVVLAKVFPPSRVGAKAAFADIKEPDDDPEDKPAKLEIPVAEAFPAEDEEETNEEVKPRSATPPPQVAPVAPPAVKKARKAQAVS